MDTFQNFVYSKLAAGISATDTTATILAGEGVLYFPTSNFRVAIYPANMSPLQAYRAGKWEMCFVASRTDDVLTFSVSGGVREAIEDTLPISHNDPLLTYIVECVWTAGMATAKEDKELKSIDVTADANSNIKYPSVKAVKDYADALVVGLLDDRGNYNPSSGMYPTSGGSGFGTAGAIILKGDIWFISVAGTIGGVAVYVGDSIRATQDLPGQDPTKWDILNAGLGFIPVPEWRKVNGYELSSDISITAADISTDTTHRFVTDQDIIDWNSLVTFPGFGTDHVTAAYGDHNHSGLYELLIAVGTTFQYWRGDKTWQTLDKSAVGLGSVEDTALSTWAGSTNITTLGTIATCGGLTASGSIIGTQLGVSPNTLRGIFDLYVQPDPPAPASGTGTMSASGANGNYCSGVYPLFKIRVLPYQVASGTTFYSVDYLEIASTDDYSGEARVIKFDWDAVAGVDGYRVIISDSQYQGSDWVDWPAYVDVPTNHAYFGDSDALESTVIYGTPAVTPTTGAFIAPASGSGVMSATDATGNYSAAIIPIFKVRVRPYKTVDSVKIYGIDYLEITLTDDLSRDYRVINFDWDAVPGAEGYIVDTSDGGYFSVSPWNNYVDVPTNHAYFGDGDSLENTSIYDVAPYTPFIPTPDIYVDAVGTLISRYGITVGGNIVSSGSLTLGVPLADAYIASATTWNAKYGSGSSVSLTGISNTGHTQLGDTPVTGADHAFIDAYVRIVPGTNRTTSSLMISDTPNSANTPHSLLNVERKGPVPYSALDETGAARFVRKTDPLSAIQPAVAYGIEAFVSVGTGGVTNGIYAPSTVIGGRFISINLAAGTVTDLIGITTQTQHNSWMGGGPATVSTNAIGIKCVAHLLQNGTMTNAWGAYFDDQTVGGTENAAIRFATEGKLSWNNDVTLYRSGVGALTVSGTIAATNIGTMAAETATNYVPFTGAGSDLDLGIHTIKSGITRVISATAYAAQYWYDAVPNYAWAQGWSGVDKLIYSYFSGTSWSTVLSIDSTGNLTASGSIIIGEAGNWLIEITDNHIEGIGVGQEQIPYLSFQGNALELGYNEEAGETESGGTIALYANNGGATSGDGGAIGIYAGSATTEGDGGNVNIQAGDGAGAGANGVINIYGNVIVSGDISANNLGTMAFEDTSGWSPVTGSSSIVTVGALNSGSITSGFGSIDIGTDTLGCGAITSSGNISLTTASNPNLKISHSGVGVDWRIGIKDATSELLLDNATIDFTAPKFKFFGSGDFVHVGNSYALTVGDKHAEAARGETKFFRQAEDVNGIVGMGAKVEASTAPAGGNQGSLHFYTWNYGVINSTDVMVLDGNGNLSLSRGTLTLPNSNTLTGNSGSVGFSGGITSVGNINSYYNASYAPFSVDVSRMTSTDAGQYVKLISHNDGGVENAGITFLSESWNGRFDWKVGSDAGDKTLASLVRYYPEGARFSLYKYDNSNNFSVDKDGNIEATGTLTLPNSNVLGGNTNSLYVSKGLHVGGTSDVADNSLTVDGATTLATTLTVNSVPTSGLDSFGDGSDGSVTFDGAATILGMVPSANVYTMTRDINCNNITVNAGITVKTAGFIIHATGTVSIAATGVIHCNGGAGSGVTKGGAQYTTSRGLYPCPNSGGQGAPMVEPGTVNGAGGAVSAALIPVTCVPYVFRAGGGGGGGGNHSGVAVNGAVVSSILCGAIGGVGGAGTGGGTSDLAGGGGGAGGGVVIVYAYVINNAGTISSNGGNGGAGATSGSDKGGNGGGGGGGTVVIFYRSTTGSGVGTLTAVAGSAGSGGNGGSNGNAGITASFQI